MKKLADQDTVQLQWTRTRAKDQSYLASSWRCICYYTWHPCPFCRL